MTNQRGAYGEFVKPALAELLSVLRLDIDYIRGRGDYLYYDSAGRGEAAALDLAGGFGSTILGHNAPEIVEERRRCLEECVPLHAQGSCREAAGRLASLLDQVFPGSEKRYAVFTNSGAESVEAALKHAELVRMRSIEAVCRKIYRSVWEFERAIPTMSRLALPEPFAQGGWEAAKSFFLSQIPELGERRPVIVAAERSFHGKTVAALGVTGNPVYRRPFAGLVGAECIFIPFNDAEALDRALDRARIQIVLPALEGDMLVTAAESISCAAAVIMEPVQGEGGIHAASPEFMAALVELKDRYDYGLILDEIQSGMGRTGRMFAMEHYDIDYDRIDYVTLSKALGGGASKLGALLVRESVYDPDFGVLHTSTFAEDTEGARVGAKVIQTLSDRNGALLRAAADKGALFMDKLNALQARRPGVIAEVRGLGLFIGVEFADQSDNPSIFFQRTSAQGVLGALIAGFLFHENSIRTAPPLNSMLSAKPANIIRIEPSVHISEADMDRVIAGLDHACETIEKSNAYAFSKYIVGLATPGETPRVRDYSAREKPRRSSFADDASGDMRRMAFLIHPLDIDQVCQLFDPSLENLSPERDPATGRSQREEYWDRLVPMVDSFVFRDHHVRSPRTGDQVNAKFIAFPYTTRQMNELRRSDPAALIKGVQKAVDLGAALGAQLVGLGAFTSIVTNNGTDLDDTFVRLTTGNSYTTALIIESVRKAARMMELDLDKSTGVVVGAAGNIGSVTANLMSEDMGRLILVGSSRQGTLEALRDCAVTIYSDTVDLIRSARPDQLGGLAARIARDMLLPLGPLADKKLRFREEEIDACVESNFEGDTLKIARLLKSIFYRRPDPAVGAKLFDAIKIKHGHDPYISLSADIEASVRQADVLVSAVSAHEDIIDVDWIKPGALVNDVSLPPAVSEQVYTRRPDVLAIQGGIGRLPEYIDLGIPGLAVGATLGCMAETFILTMMNMIDNYSFGRISKHQVTKIWEAGRILGFGLAAIKHGDSALTPEAARAVARLAASG